MWLGQQVALMMVDIPSGRDLVKDKAGEELNAITGGIKPNTFLRLLDGIVRYRVEHIDN